MRFQISNVDYPKKTPPCEGAYQVERFTGDGDPWYIDIGTLEELMGLMKRVKYDLILSETSDIKGVPSIRIYDGYNE